MRMSAGATKHAGPGLPEAGDVVGPTAAPGAIALPAGGSVPVVVICCRRRHVLLRRRSLTVVSYAAARPPRSFRRRRRPSPAAARSTPAVYSASPGR